MLDIPMSPWRHMMVDGTEFESVISDKLFSVVIAADNWLKI